MSSGSCPSIEVPRYAEIEKIKLCYFALQVALTNNPSPVHYPH